MLFINRQRAVAICKAEVLDFTTLKTGEPLLLKSGAKLYKQFKAVRPEDKGAEYSISGYAADGSDVICYRRS